MVVDDLDALCLEPSLLLFVAPEGKVRRKPALRVDNAVTGNHRRVQIAMQSISDGTRSASVARHRRYLTIGRDFSVRNFTNGGVDTIFKAIFPAHI